MRYVVISIVALFAFLQMVPAVTAANPVPEVYSDDFISIHAGIPDAGVKPRHIGDELEFVLQVELASKAVRIEELDQSFFQRSFAAVPAFRGSDPPQLTTRAVHDRKVMTAVWSFQVVDCPDSRIACPGSKHYMLPALSLSYEVLDESGQLLNNRSARFRPWPGEVMISPVTSTDAGPAGDLTDFFPGGAYPEPVAVATHQSQGLLAMLCGVLLLALSYATLARKEHSPFRPATLPAHSRRWEELFSRLENSDLADDRWADALRRCLTQYCQDELNTNPYEWFNNAARDNQAPEQPRGEWRKLVYDVLQHEAIPARERAAFIARFTELARLPPR